MRLLSRPLHRCSDFDGSRIWWKKRRDRQFVAQYQQVSALHEEEELNLKRYSQYVRPESYEMPAHRGSLYSDS